MGGYPAFEKAFRAAAHAARLDLLDPVPYLLRHTGASADALHRRRDLSEIKTRGRWTSDVTVRRYEKRARIQSQFAKLPQPLQVWVSGCLGNLSFWFAAPHLVPPVPDI